MPLFVSPRRRLVAVANLLVAALLAWRAQAEPAEVKPAFVVSSYDLGTVDQEIAKSAELAAELNDREWCTATAAPVGGTWRSPPPAVDRRAWLSVVTVGFGEQGQAYAFRFDGPGDSVRLVSHVAHRKRFSRGIKVWTSPFVRLLNALRVNGAGSVTAPRPLVQLEIVDAKPATGSARSTGAGKPVMDEALTLPPEKVRPPLEAILAAAAYQAGYAPTFAAAADRLRVEVAVHDQACSFRITSSVGGKEAVTQKDRVPWEEFHDQLVRLFAMTIGPTPVREFVRLDPDGASLLAADGGKLFCLVDDELTALDAANGRESWRVRIAQSPLPTATKKVERYAIRRTADGRPRLIRWTKSLSEFAAADGTETPLAPLAAATETAFDVDSSGRAVVAADSRVVVFHNGAEVWSHTEPQPITAGPLLDGERVLFGIGDALAALSLADGRPLWRVAVDRTTGSITPAGSLRLVTSYENESLTAVDGDKGAVRWRIALGDVPVQAPIVHGETIWIATKQNRLLKLNLVDGTIAFETRWPTWIDRIGLATIADRVQPVIADLNGRITILDEAGKTWWQAQLAARRTGEPLVIQVPETWHAKPGQAKPKDDILAAIESDAVAVRPFLLSTDASGFLEKLSLPVGGQR